ncbi:uncharacterized protein LOC121877687 [Homarus americanus]|uniref:uncharacterized protein LOC121877687 n=1 Tax=Homarus americanus TaxID=6706 RepID=UPI001C470298|nr:uncharacterized protein LOC121877687 [Homarus americanus]
MMNLTDCGDYLYNGVCSKKNWVSESILQDTDSGLYQVRANPETASMDVIGFTPGTRDQVQVTYASHCCNTEVEVIGVDGQGNVGKCLINMDCKVSGSMLSINQGH